MISQLICHTRFGDLIMYESLKSGNQVWFLGHQQFKQVTCGCELFTN